MFITSKPRKFACLHTLLHRLKDELKKWERTKREPLNWPDDKLMKSLKVVDDEENTILQLCILEQKHYRIKALWELRMKKFADFSIDRARLKASHFPNYRDSETDVQLMKKMLRNIGECKITLANNKKVFKDIIRVLHQMQGLSVELKEICYEETFHFVVRSLEEVLVPLGYDRYHFTENDDEAEMMLEAAGHLYAKLYKENQKLLCDLLIYCRECLDRVTAYLQCFVKVIGDGLLEGYWEENDIYDRSEQVVLDEPTVPRANVKKYTVQKLMEELKKADNGPLKWSEDMLLESLTVVDDDKHTILQVCIQKQKKKKIEALFQLRREKKFTVISLDCNRPKEKQLKTNYYYLLAEIGQRELDYWSIGVSCHSTFSAILRALNLMHNVCLKAKEVCNEETFFFLRAIEEIVGALGYDSGHHTTDETDAELILEQSDSQYVQLYKKNVDFLEKLFSYCEESLKLMKIYLKAIVFFNQVKHGPNVSVASLLWQENFKKLLTTDGLSILEVAAKRGNPKLFSWLLEACELKIGDNNDDDNPTTSAAKIMFQAVNANEKPALIIDRLFKAIPSESWDDLLSCKLDSEENTPLHYAVLNQNFDAVLKLCEYGAVLYAPNKNTLSPKSLIKTESDDIRQFFEQMDQLFEAAKNKNFQRVDKLLEEPETWFTAKLNSKNLEGRTVNMQLRVHLGTY